MAEVAVRADVPEHLRGRVDRMFKRDARAAITLIVVLWLTIFFVILGVRPYMPPGVEPVCWIAAAILLLYNTASLVAREARMAKIYVPPKQGVAGQLFDVAFLLALVFAALFLPLWLKIAVPS